MECLKWELRLQQEMKIVQTLAKENLQLQKEKEALRREKNAWKILYEENNASNNDKDFRTKKQVSCCP